MREGLDIDANIVGKRRVNVNNQGGSKNGKRKSKKN